MSSSGAEPAQDLSPDETFEVRRRREGIASDRCGSGGMGTVWPVITSARHASRDQVIRPQFAERPDARRRFRDRGPAAGASTPSMREVYDYGVTDKGLPYIVWSTSRASRLRALIARPPPRAARRRRSSRRRQGPREAHAASIVHRDLKPDNIFLRPTSGRDRDLGYLCELSTSDREMLTRPREGGLKGRRQEGSRHRHPNFMSPEELTSAGPRTRSRTSVAWCVAFAEFTARIPFEGEVLATSC